MSRLMLQSSLNRSHHKTLKTHNNIHVIVKVVNGQRFEGDYQRVNGSENDTSKEGDTAHGQIFKTLSIRSGTKSCTVEDL